MNRFSSKIWRLEHLYFIENKEGNRVKFKFNKVQSDYHQQREKYRRIIMCKSRKHGISTYEVIDSLDSAIFTPGYHGVIVSYDKASAKDIFSKVRYAMDNMIPEIRDMIQVEEETLTNIVFLHDRGNGIVLKSSLSVVTTARGTTPSRAHITELPRMEKMQKGKAQEVLDGTTQAVPLSGSVTIESTPNGEGDLFHSIFDKSMKSLQSGDWNENDYYPLFYNWRWDVTEVAKAPTYREMPEELYEYQKKHDLTDQEIFFYYTKLRSLNMSWNSMKKEYPTTISEAFQAVQEGAIFENEIDLWYNEDRITVVPYDPRYPVYVFADIGRNDLTCLVFIQKVGLEIRVIDYYENRLLGTSHYVDYIRNCGYRIDMVFLPHDAGNKAITNNRHVKSYYDAAHIRNVLMQPSSEGERIDAIQVHSHAMVFDQKKTEKLISHIKKVHRRPGAEKVVHNEESNAFDALGYMALHADNINSIASSRGIEVIA